MRYPFMAVFLLSAATLFFSQPSALMAQTAPRAGQATLVSEYFECVLKRRPKEVTSFLEIAWGDKNIGSEARKLSVNSCVPSKRQRGQVKFQFNWTTLRHGLFVAKYKHDFKNLSAIDFSDTMMPDPKVEMKAPNAKGRIWLMKVAGCVAQRESTLSHDVLLAQRGSKNQITLLQGLAQAIDHCSDGGGTRTIDPDRFLGQLAEALYGLRTQSVMPN